MNEIKRMNIKNHEFILIDDMVDDLEIKFNTCKIQTINVERL